MHRKWLRELAESALGQYGIANAKLRFISESSATVFRVDTASQRYVLRINREPPERWMGWTEAELLWLLAIKRDTELWLPAPLTLWNGYISIGLAPRISLLVQNFSPPPSRELEITCGNDSISFCVQIDHKVRLYP